MEDTFTMSPSPLALSKGVKARMVANTPRGGPTNGTFAACDDSDMSV
jgi:hypothetical protein